MPVQPPSRSCKDCLTEGITTNRPAPYQGPRCATHWRRFRAARRAASRAAHVEKTYSITEDQYQALYEAQGRCCAICQRATGTGRKRLAVDHDHACCPGPVSCGRCVRGLLCKPCNSRVLGHLRDDVTALQRAIDYLTNPPAKRVLRRG